MAPGARDTQGGAVDIPALDTELRRIWLRMNTECGGENVRAWATSEKLSAITRLC